MRAYSSVKQVMRSGKAEFLTAFQNPNARFAMIGIIGAAILLLAMVVGLRIFEKAGAIEPFLQQWKQAVESKQPTLYQQLWDSTARIKNRSQYERALKLFSREKVEANIAGLLPRKDFRDNNRRQIERIPVTLYQDGEVLVMLHRDLTIEKKGLLQRWKLINDRIRDELEYPETTEEHIVQEPPPPVQSTNLTPASPPSQPLNDTVASNNVTPDSTANVTPDSTSPIVREAPLDTQLKLSQVLGEWQQAWQGKNLKTYMSKYAEDAAITRVTVNKGREYPTQLSKAQLREKMKALNKRYSKIEVNIFHLQVNGDSAVADVNFFQEFVGRHASGSQPAYSDFGMKQLVFMVDPADGLWKIYSENWKHYKNVPKYPKL